MRNVRHNVAGVETTIRFYEGSQDRDAFLDWLAEPRPALALDTETTGLDIYSVGYAVRLVQFGDAHGAWVLPARYSEEIRLAVSRAKRLVCHNMSHDLHSISVYFGIPLEETYPKTVDTFILSHILDPRSKEEDSTVLGHGLKDLAAHYVDFNAREGDKALKAIFKENKWTGATGWTLIPEDTEEYWRYAGLDVIYTARLLKELMRQLPKKFNRLLTFEHQLAFLIARMERRGILLDVPYTEKLHETLSDEVTVSEAEIFRMCKEIGAAKLTPRAERDICDLIHLTFAGFVPKRRQSNGKFYVPMSSSSNQTIIKAMQEMGETFTEVTPSGALSIGKEILNDLCDVNMAGERLEVREPNPLAVLVKAAKRAGKWNSSYVETMLTTMDADNRVHPKIQGLKARTARMSISVPPFQQLPSSGRTIRDCLIADPGYSLISCDYDQVEMKVLAGFTQEEKMVQAILDGADLHDYTATLVYGEGFTNKQRKALKNAGFGKVYGGGAATISKQVGISLSEARTVVKAYDETYPGIKEYSTILQNECKGEEGLAVYSPMFGRRLPADDNRVYAVVNYMIQSTARDIFAQSLLDMAAAGLDDCLLLPVHDEIIAQAPSGDAEEVAKLIGQTMTTTFEGVPVTASGDVIGDRWGNAYSA